MAGTTGLELRPIGVIHSPYKTVEEAPRQGAGGSFEVEIFEEFEEGLRDVEGFSHLYLLYWLHKSGEREASRGDLPLWKKHGNLVQQTPWDEEPHGVFAIRSPVRPNPIGLSLVELLKRRGRFLTVSGLDAIDGTPLIDIKPYCPRRRVGEEMRFGWLGKEDVRARMEAGLRGEGRGGGRDPGVRDDGANPEGRLLQDPGGARAEEEDSC